MRDGIASWQDALGSDPVPWLLASGEPAARWIALTSLLDRPPDDPAVLDAHRAVLADGATAALADRLPDWEAGVALSGHDSPGFAPNVLGLLADMGVGPGEIPAADRVLAAMLRHRDEAGRFASYGTSRASREPAWGALLCDSHAVLEVLVRFGFASHPAVQLGITRIEADLAMTSQGTGWPCIPSGGFRGPGRKGEVCPQVTLEAVRLLGRMGHTDGPGTDGARTLLAVWRERGVRQPYMFGHGYRFKVVKWPAFWYSALAVLDAVDGYPGLWRGPAARAEDRRSVAELAACLVAYNCDPSGRVTPRSCYRGFEAFSFGQKSLPSPLATALVACAVRRVDDLADEIAALDVLSLGSSRGGTGTPRPPRAPSAADPAPGRHASP